MSTVRVKPQFSTDAEGQEIVKLSLRQYKRLMRYVEDLEDALRLDELRRNAVSFRSYKEIRQELKQTGLL